MEIIFGEGSRHGLLQHSQQEMAQLHCNVKHLWPICSLLKFHLTKNTKKTAYNGGINIVLSLEQKKIGIVLSYIGAKKNVNLVPLKLILTFVKKKG